MKDYIDLFWTFFRIGGLTFGGGYAMLPMLQKEVVENKKWATEEELLDYYAVGQCTPGVIAVNTATFIGYKLHGVLGAIAATLGVVFPSLVIIMSIAAFLQNFEEIAWVQHAFNGIRVAVCVLVLNAIIKLWKSSVVDKLGVAIVILTFVLGVFLNVSPVYIVIIATSVGILLYVKEKGGRK
ncbi:MAG TPA: chromate transporter [Firmicutes bacterium]|nr:chromate transporter [Bacillota bacterium]